LGEVYNITKMKINRNFRVFIDFILFELDIPIICLIIGGVSVYRERYYNIYSYIADNPVYWKIRQISIFTSYYINRTRIISLLLTSNIT
jgi:hypothetical protein